MFSCGFNVIARLGSSWWPGLAVLDAYHVIATSSVQIRPGTFSACRHLSLSPSFLSLSNRYYQMKKKHNVTVEDLKYQGINVPQQCIKSPCMLSFFHCLIFCSCPGRNLLDIRNVHRLFLFHNDTGQRYSNCLQFPHWDILSTVM